MIIPTCGALINGEASYSFTLKNRLFAKEDELSPMVQHERDQERKDVLSDTKIIFQSVYDPIPKKFSKLITDRLTSKLTKHTKHVILGSMVIMP